MAEEVKTMSTNGAEKTSLTAFMDMIHKDESTDGGTNETSTDDTTSDDTTTDEPERSNDADTSSEDSGEESRSDDVSKGDAATVYEVKGQKVEVKDLINSYETRGEISKRFDEIGKREQRIIQERERIAKERAEIDYINEKFQEMHEQVIAGNPLAAMQIAMSMASNGEKDTPEGMESLIKQSIAIADNFHAMSDDEQKVFLRQQDLELKEKKLKRKQDKDKAADEQKQLQSYYENSLSTHKITDDEVNIAYDDIQKDELFKAELDKKDQKEKISYCISWVLGKRLRATVNAGVSKVKPELLNDEKFVLALFDAINPRCTVDDVAHIVKDYVETTSPNSAKVETAASKQSPPPKKSGTSDRAPTDKAKAERIKPITNWADMVAKHS